MCSSDWWVAILSSISFWFPCFMYDVYAYKMKPMIIGIAGRAGSGKSTLANMLTSRHGYKELNFADPLKDMARALGFKVDTQQDKQTIHPYWKLSGRHFLQLWGTQVGRQLVPEVISQMPNIWIQHMDMRLTSYCNEEGVLTQSVVVADVRFPDEAQMIKENGGIVIHLSRDDEQQMTHISERDLPRSVIDYWIINNGTREELYQQCMSLLKRHQENE
jgi:hypothetical protein